MGPLRSSASAKFGRQPQLAAAAVVAQLLVALALAALPGCAAPPVAKGVKAEFQPPTAEGVQAAVTMELTQPNDGALELIEWDYTATVNGKQVFQGTWAALLTLPPYNVTMTTTIPVVIPIADAGDLAHARWKVSGSVGYRATRQMDKLLYQLGISRQAADFEASGEGFIPAPPPPAPKTDAAQPGAPNAPGGRP